MGNLNITSVFLLILSEGGFSFYNIFMLVLFVCFCFLSFFSFLSSSLNSGDANGTKLQNIIITHPII